jgi:hypothetical protein
MAALGGCLADIFRDMVQGVHQKAILTVSGCGAESFMLCCARQGMSSLRQKITGQQPRLFIIKKVSFPVKINFFCISAILSACAGDLYQKPPFFAAIDFG